MLSMAMLQDCSPSFGVQSLTGRAAAGDVNEKHVPKGEVGKVPFTFRFPVMCVVFR